MTDKELLELAAKAAEIEIIGDYHSEPWIKVEPIPGIALSDIRRWNPLKDDGDALRLAVKLKFDVVHGKEHVFVGNVLSDRWLASEFILLADDTKAATRRAIVRAAAEIGGRHDRLEKTQGADT